MIVVSTFDGIGLGYEALSRIGRKPAVYFASEVDKNAIKVAKHRHPEIIQLGDVCNVTRDLLLPRPDLLLGGSPCQGFSKFGKGEGLQHDGSKLFYEFVRIKKELNPKNFLLENVQMSNADNAIVTRELGVEPILINSNLVSAQNRPRLYWTDIPGVKQPRDKRLFFPNICEYDMPRLFKKTVDIDGNYNLGDFLKRELPRPLTFSLRRTDQAKRLRSESFRNKTGDVYHWSHREYFARPDLKCNCIMTKPWKETVVLDEDNDFRRMSILEMERAQTLTDNYTDVGLAESVRHHLIGNGWTVDVIAHILSFMP